MEEEEHKVYRGGNFERVEKTTETSLAMERSWRQGRAGEKKHKRRETTHRSRGKESDENTKEP